MHLALAGLPAEQGLQLKKHVAEAALDQIKPIVEVYQSKLQGTSKLPPSSPAEQPSMHQAEHHQQASQTCRAPACCP